jgi:hypothetical protein
LTTAIDSPPLENAEITACVLSLPDRQRITVRLAVVAPDFTAASHSSAGRAPGRRSSVPAAGHLRRANTPAPGRDQSRFVSKSVARGADSDGSKRFTVAG